MKKSLAILLASLALNALAATDPSSLILKIYQVSVSTSTDCSNPQTILLSVAGTETDFISNPVIGSGTLADGTYPCVMITMDDVIKFTPLANSGAFCVAGVEYTADLCRTQASGGGGSIESSYTDLLEGTTVTRTECAGTSQTVAGGGVANKATLYLRTTAPGSLDPNANDAGSWMKGIVAANANNGGTTPTIQIDNGIQLASPFIVAGTNVGIFYLDATGQVDDNSGNTHCEMGAPIFGFRD